MLLIVEAFLRVAVKWNGRQKYVTRLKMVMVGWVDLVGMMMLAEENSSMIEHLERE